MNRWLAGPVKTTWSLMSRKGLGEESVADACGPSNVRVSGCHATREPSRVAAAKVPAHNRTDRNRTREINMSTFLDRSESVFKGARESPRDESKPQKQSHKKRYKAATMARAISSVPAVPPKSV